MTKRQRKHKQQGDGPSCPRCTRPALGGTICPDCNWDLHRLLRSIPALERQLETVLTRQTVYAQRVGTARSAVTPLPVDLSAGRALEALHAGLQQVLRRFRPEPFGQAGPVCVRCRHTSCWAILGPGTTTPSIARWLDIVPDIRTHPAAAAIADEVTDLTAAARAKIDAPVDRTTFPVGPCPDCASEVRAYIPADGSGLVAVLACATKPTEHVWDSTQWRRLGRRMRPPAALVPVARRTLQTVTLGPCAGCRKWQLDYPHGTSDALVGAVLADHVAECPRLARMLNQEAS